MKHPSFELTSEQTLRLTELRDLLGRDLPESIGETTMFPVVDYSSCGSTCSQTCLNKCAVTCSSSCKGTCVGGCNSNCASVCGPSCSGYCVTYWV